MCLSSKGYGLCACSFQKNGRKIIVTDTANTKFLFERSYVIMKENFIGKQKRE